MAIPLSYNVRNVFQRPGATAATVVGVGFTVAILIAALALAAGFQQALIQTGSFDNALALRKGADSEISSTITRDAANILRAHPDVAVAPDGHPLVSPEVVVLINQPRLGQPGSSNVTIRGVDEEAFLLRGRLKIVEGRMFRPGSDEVIIGQRIARRFKDCRVGDHLRFGQQAFTVVGHFTAGGTGFESEIWGDNKVLMPVFRGEVFQSVTFRMKNPFRFDAIKGQLEDDPRLGIQLRRERDYYAEQSSMLAGVIRYAGVFITLIMAVGAMFGAMNTMFASIGARTREVATLMVLGFSPWAIMSSFMIESVILSLLGGLLGCLLALPINGITTSTTNFSSFSEVAFAFRVTPAALFWGLVFSAAMGVLGGFLPALQAARRPIATSLREM
jgi:ABC-type lipoprotein release transport system permease subunit